MNTNFNKPEKIKRAAIYFRVSTEEQVLNWTSLDTQEKDLKKYIYEDNKGKYTLDEDRHIFKDEWKSWRNDDREWFKNMMRAAKNKEIDVILVYKLDRFFRSVRLAVNYTYELWNIWVWLISIKEKLDTSNVFWEAMFQFLLIFAQLESDIIAARTTLWKRSRAVDWYYVSGWTPPYWYNLVNKKLAINEEESKIVKEIYSLFISGISVSEIIKDLNKRQVPVNSMKIISSKRKVEEINKRIEENKYKNQNEKDDDLKDLDEINKYFEKTEFWAWSFVYKILSNPIYFWKYIYWINKNKKYKDEKQKNIKLMFLEESDDDKNKSNTDSDYSEKEEEEKITINKEYLLWVLEWTIEKPESMFLVDSPRILWESDEEWKEIYFKALDILEKNRRTWKRWIKYLFSWKIRSSITWYSFSGYMKKKSNTTHYHIIKATTKANYDKVESWNISESELIEKFIDFLKELLTTPKLKLLDLVKERYNKWNNTDFDEEYKKTIEEKTKEIIILKKQIATIYDDRLDEKISIEQYEEKTKFKNDKLDFLKKEIEELQKIVNWRKNIIESCQDAQNFIKKLNLNIIKLDDDQKRNLADILIDKIEVDLDRITYYLKLSPEINQYFNSNLTKNKEAKGSSWDEWW